ncbi:protein of unknown function (DUF4386) [Micromonospora matsumotoense]|uniref:DUF4386 domain-containing protein n=1 Tax=Micromonospora matsumotoense TaxID=121616 RepID=A0A1C4XFA8_9ACTN|nr:DUF4386 domain-containing protein [Micromonospora matsumotoense]SCF07165.1 protein of unknown function (DUF4386) [Micromonospora matsumotoense]
MSLRVAGRWAGAFFLSAFVAYGLGSALAGQPAGVTLVVLNSVLVAAIGGLAFRALRRAHPGAAWTYLVARGAEAFLLTAGIVLRDRVGAGAGDLAYQLAMLALGLGSLPFCLALARRHWLPRWLALWGTVGYALLAVGAAAELAGMAVGVVLAAPGGLFEIVFGLLLLTRGFTPAGAATAGPGTPASAAGPGTPAASRAGALTSATEAGEPITAAGAGEPASATGAAGAGPDRSRARRAALAAGLGLLLMAVLAGWANFAVVQPLVDTDAAGSARRLPARQGALTLAVVALFTVACLDVLVGWALRTFLGRTRPTVALLSAWCRTGYAIVLAVALTHLIAVAGLLRDGAGADRLAAEGHPRLTDFQQVWELGLLLFGVHLLLVGGLCWRSPTVPTWVAALVGVAGAGYLADSVGSLLPAGHPVQVSGVTFVGEVVLMGWLLAHAARHRSPGRRVAPGPDRRPLIPAR